MRVAMVSPYSLSVPGGVQGQALSLAAALRRAGHEAVVLAPLDGPVPDAEHGAGVVAVGRSIAVPANGSVARLAVGPLTWIRTWRALDRFMPHVVHLHEPLAPGPTWSALARGEPKVGTFHRAGAVKAASVLAPLARFAVGRLDVCAAVSEEASRTAQDLADGSYRIIGNAVDVERFTGAAPISTQGPTVVFVGRHEDRKGLRQLCTAFRAMSAEFEQAHLWVIGHGPDTGALEAEFAGSAGISWLGALDDAAVAERLAGSDVLCAPSLYGESFGVVLLEALAASCVVVASDLAGYRAVLGDLGVLVKPGSPEGLEAGLRRALQDVESGSGLASPAARAAGLAHCRQWSTDAIASRYVELYGQARERHGSGGAAP
ncbi:MAG: glycosyltransferase family 4 protein [Acidimicrobiales bacterium]